MNGACGDNLKSYCVVPSQVKATLYAHLVYLFVALLW